MVRASSHLRWSDRTITRAPVTPRCRSRCVLAIVAAIPRSARCESPEWVWGRKTASRSTRHSTPTRTALPLRFARGGETTARRPSAAARCGLPRSTSVRRATSKHSPAPTSPAAIRAPRWATGVHGSLRFLPEAGAADLERVRSSRRQVREPEAARARRSSRGFPELTNDLRVRRIPRGDARRFEAALEVHSRIDGRSHVVEGPLENPDETVAVLLGERDMTPANPFRIDPSSVSPGHQLEHRVANRLGLRLGNDRIVVVVPDVATTPAGCRYDRQTAKQVFTRRLAGPLGGGERQADATGRKNPDDAARREPILVDVGVRDFAGIVVFGLLQPMTADEREIRHETSEVNPLELDEARVTHGVEAFLHWRGAKNGLVDESILVAKECFEPDASRPLDLRWLVAEHGDFRALELEGMEHPRHHLVRFSTVVPHGEHDDVIGRLDEM